MHRSDSFRALRKANPRARADFAWSVEAAADIVRARIATTGAAEPRAVQSAPRRRLVGFSFAGAALAVAAAGAALFATGSPSGGPGVEDAAAAVKKAATLTAASADRSGIAVVRITHNGEVWVASTIRWHGKDLSVSQDEPQRGGRARSKLLLVDGTMYGIEDGEWVVLGSPDSVDSDSGTTPGEYLAAVRQDVGGATLRRITNGMTGLTASALDDGSTVYSGTVAAGLIAPESGFKGGEAIRVFPFGHVAHDEAANADAPLDVVVTVGADGIVREIAVTWGTIASAWNYTVAYSALGKTPAPAAPENARDLLRERLSAG